MAFGKEMAMMGGKAKFKGEPKEKSEKKPEPKKEEGEAGGGDGMSLHSHGDGSYHTEPDGEQHDHLGKALMHLAHHHEPDGKHMHIHHDGLSVRSHGVHESGEHDGPMEHEDTEGTKAHMDQFFNGTEQGQPEAPEQEHSLGGYGG